ncbi:MAG: SgcJ/EcaC family oxidoreductase [Alphaproteobacteria bacterium]|nr:SgcJ/EcaC family oxidoreductase [Alphaproteobacteria bacterium]MBU0795248.1 SgcJ/EcaC family oxidoreductase [Alphaproteobacteria bacterium]MBU0876690.1 SgcJ/EcaC family oxidoreductase [Alphaproteobacteria bacterium]MBU1769392.1 SgcJ/EcaC family oxidoreductase [Alphaproteobacteria bacterium]
MIGSLREAWQGKFPGDTPDSLPSTRGNLTRANFLRVMTAGALAVGFGGVGKAASGTSSVPPVVDLDKFYDAWQERLNAGDLEGLVDLYVEDVTYVNSAGQLLHGKAKVRKDFEGLLAIKPQIVLGNRQHVVYRDIVLTTNHWRMNFTNADGIKQEMTGGGIEVIRKDTDGGWRFIIDDASRSASK